MDTLYTVTGMIIWSITGAYVLYPWPWLLVKDRKHYIERYEARERGC